VGFTLVELMVAIGIIAVLISILIPTVSAARESARTLKCQSNLRQLGMAFHMYASEQRQYLPYPDTTFPNASDDERFLWFNALDRYLGSSAKGQEARSGVAKDRAYAPIKQCVVWESFEGDATSGSQTSKESAKTYKMNIHLAHPNPAGHAKITDVKRSSEFVMMGDGISMDATGDVANQTESERFYLEINKLADSSPALRHQGGANILFVDGHVVLVNYLKTITKTLMGSNSAVRVKTWESEYVDASGTPAKLRNVNLSPEAQGLRRNPNMPLIWSDPPKLYREKP
jgi:prepilin-type processing-associated H-X9-DG protein/prepilin-type N-terminal cleavage/methylation domain-containing protein